MRKLVLVGVMACGALSAAAADPREDVVSGLARCAALTDDRQWLDCYYGAAQPMRASLGLASAPQAQIKLLSAQPAHAAALPAPAARAAVRTGPPPMPKRGGMFDILGGGDVVKDAPLKSYELSGDGFTVTLQDGQVWQQTPDDANKNPARWREPATSLRATIDRGAMHTFNLVMSGENTQHKVTRIR